MKKKLFLALAISIMLVCLFAISVSATEYFGEVEIIDLDNDGASDIKVTDKIYSVIEKDNEDGVPATEDARVKINCTCEKGSHTFPAYYICTINGNSKTNCYSFDYSALSALLPEYCGSADAVTVTSLVAFEFPNGFTTAYAGLFGKKAATSMKYVSFAKNTTMKTASDATSGNNWFEATNLEAVDFGSTLTKIPSYFCHNCDSLTSVTIPDQVESIGGLAFYDCALLTTVNISEASKLTTLDARVFANCKVLEGLYIPSGITTLGIAGSNQSPFDGCTNLWFKNNPNETEKPTIYYLPTGITSIVGEIFKNCKNLNSTLVFHSGITAISDGWAFCNSNAVTLVFLGDITALSTTGNAWTKNMTIYMCNENDVSTDSFSKNTTQNFIFCNAEGNTQHLRNPKEDARVDATCTSPAADCQYCFCGYAMDVAPVEGSEALGHLYDNLTGKYYPEVNGVANYYADAIHQYFCSQCNENIEKAEKGTSLFTKYGYSVSENDSKNVSYIVYSNAALITAYAEYKNVEISYGLVVSASADGNPLAYSEGTLVADINTVKVEMQGTDYNKLTLKVANLPENQALHCNGYVVVDGTISYLNHATVDAEAAKVTHADMLALQNAETGSNEETEPEVAA